MIRGVFIWKNRLILISTMRELLRTIITTSFLMGQVGLSSAVLADDKTPILDGLFLSLQQVQDAGDAARITSEIWTRWSIHPSDETITARLNRGVTMMNQGDFVHAEALFTDIIEKDPLFAEAWNKRATLYYIQGKSNASRRDIAQTLLLEPRHFGALSGLGLIELSAGNYEAALRAYEQALTVNPHMGQAAEMIKTLEEKLRGIAL